VLQGRARPPPVAISFPSYSIRHLTLSLAPLPMLCQSAPSHRATFLVLNDPIEPK
jgi:hypothetical protein